MHELNQLLFGRVLQVVGVDENQLAGQGQIWVMK